MNELQVAALNRLERIRNGESAVVVYPGLDPDMIRRSQDSDRLAASIVALQMRKVLRQIVDDAIASTTGGNFLVEEKLIEQAKEFAE